MNVGVFPAEEFRKRELLFSALGRVFRVQFVGRAAGAWRDLDASIIFGGAPSKNQANDSGIPSFIFAEEDVAGDEGLATSPVRFASVPELDSRLVGRTLHEGIRANLADVSRDRDAVTMASSGGIPVWLIRGGSPRVEVTSVAPPELREGESLRELLSAGRFFSLLPLVHFLRVITGYHSWSRPPARAVFVFDDLNLHWPSYGDVRFQEMADHARRHGYHAAMSMIPLDAWFTHPTAARIFRERNSELSLAVHGNDHLYHEFALPLSSEKALSIFTQSLRRIERFERRSGVAVSRVSIPPHGVCAYEMLEPMRLAGFEAFCNSGSWWKKWPTEHRVAAGWDPATISPAGLPIMSRLDLGHGALRDEATLYLFLDKPVVMCGHHYDLADGYGVLAEHAEWLKTFGDVRWAPMSTLARSNVLVRRGDGGCLRVRTYSLRFEIEVSADVDTLLVEAPVDSSHLTVLCNGSAHQSEPGSFGWSRTRVPVTAGQTLDLRMFRESGVRGALEARRSSPRAYGRRTVAESRDRLQPTIRRLGLGRVLREMEIDYDRHMNQRLRASIDAMHLHRNGQEDAPRGE